LRIHDNTIDHYSEHEDILSSHISVSWLKPAAFSYKCITNETFHRRVKPTNSSWANVLPMQWTTAAHIVEVQVIRNLKSFQWCPN